MECNKCKSEHVLVSSEIKLTHRKWWVWLIWIGVIITICTTLLYDLPKITTIFIVVIVVILLLTNKRKKNKTVAICQDCGNKWVVNNGR